MWFCNEQERPEQTSSRRRNCTRRRNSVSSKQWLYSQHCYLTRPLPGLSALDFLQRYPEHRASRSKHTWHRRYLHDRIHLSCIDETCPEPANASSRVPRVPQSRTRAPRINNSQDHALTVHYSNAVERALTKHSSVAETTQAKSIRFAPPGQGILWESRKTTNKATRTRYTTCAFKAQLAAPTRPHRFSCSMRILRKTSAWCADKQEPMSREDNNTREEEEKKNRAGQLSAQLPLRHTRGGDCRYLPL